MAKNNYPEEFRRKAVDLYESTPDQTMQSIAADLGISRSALDTWVAKYGTGLRVPTAPPAATSAVDTPEATINRLETQLAAAKAEARMLTTERDILRQAAKYFAGETNW
jgi:transposase